MRSLRGLAAVLATLSAASTLTTSLAAAPADAAVRHWSVSTSAVGPIKLGESLAQLRRAGYSFYPCGGDHHPCYFRGPLGDALSFDVNGNNRIKQIMVNKASAHGTTYSTTSGVKVGTTVGAMRSRTHARSIGNYGYGPAYQVSSSPTRRITFFATGTTATAKVYSISVSTMARPIQGR